MLRDHAKKFRVKSSHSSSLGTLLFLLFLCLQNIYCHIAVCPDFVILYKVAHFDPLLCIDFWISRNARYIKKKHFDFYKKGSKIKLNKNLKI